MVLCLLGEFRDAVFRPQVHFTDIRQFVIPWSRETERVFESVDDRWVTLKEVLQTFRQTRDNHDGIIFPFIHLHKQLVERVYLIGVFVRQEFLHIVKEQYAAPGLPDVIVPLVHKPLIVHCIDHRQFRFLNDLVLIEIVTKDLRKHGLSCSRLTNDDSIDGYPDL